MVRIALGQIDTTVGDLEGNVEMLAEHASSASEAGADLVCFPELAITGYPPEDLVLRPAFVDDNLAALADLARRTAGGCDVVVGFADRSDAGVHNAAAVLKSGEVAARYHKIRLPNFGVFDERRTFESGTSACRVQLNAGGTDVAFGISICEDAWSDGEPFADFARDGSRADVIVNINGSPYHRGKTHERLDICRDRAAQTGAWIVYVNAVGGQDELVFDGGSMVVAPDGSVAARAARFEEALLLVDIEGELASSPEVAGEPDRAIEAGGAAEVYGALELGLRDYVTKNGFHEVVIGLSGGVDSSLVAVLAADALGPAAVRALAMPSRFSSPESLEDAREVARRLAIRLDVVPIDDAFDAYRHGLDPLFAGADAEVARENLQARVRGNLLMGLSNAFGSIVLATGNKSEYAVGYSTLYGDMAGGFAPIKDVPKTLVYDLVRWRNRRGGEPPIPDRVLSKPPSAELRPNQKDTDTLPPYEELDPVIEAYVEEDRSPEDIVARGGDRKLVERVVDMIDHAEYKRRQAAPGVKITPKAFGRDRRMPITNRYRREG
jgi:NAD+ synthase (glutamine-hydrolysing)